MENIGKPTIFKYFQTFIEVLKFANIFGGLGPDLDLAGTAGRPKTSKNSGKLKNRNKN